MKNIFKFFGFAVLACSMMVACGGDEENPGNEPGNDNPPAPQSSFVFNFDGDDYTVIDFQAVNHSDEGYLTVYGYTTNQGQSGIFTQGFLESTVIANGTYESTLGDIMNFRDPNMTYYDAEGILDNQNHQPATYWGWASEGSTFVENVTAIDLNARTMSANWTVNVVALEDYVNNQGYAGCTGHPFTGEIINSTWAWASK